MAQDSPLHDQVYELVQQLLAEGATEGSIAQAGGMTRQALNARGLNRPTGTRPQRLGFGFAVLRAAYQRKHVGEVISILSGEQVQLTTGFNAILLFPDLTSEELWKLLKLEELLQVKPLPNEMIRKIVETLRAPSV